MVEPTTMVLFLCTNILFHLSKQKVSNLFAHIISGWRLEHFKFVSSLLRVLEYY